MSQKITRRNWLAGSAAVAVGSIAFSPSKTSAQSNSSPNVNPTADNPIQALYNENAYGQDHKVRKVIEQSINQSHIYVDEEYYTLLQLMADVENLPVEYVNIAAGSTEFLRDAAFMNRLDGGEIIVPHPTFADFVYYAEALGSKVIKVPVADDKSISLDNIRAAITDKVKLIYLCNPNNPIPTIIEKNELKEFIAEMSELGITVLVDEAYYEYVETPRYESMIGLVKEFKNVVVTRSASKIHGFAGVRFGVCYAHPEYTSKTIQLQGNTLGKPAVLGALECYKGSDFPAFIRKKNEQSQQIVFNMLDELGLDYAESHANFIFFDSGHPTSEVIETLKKHHILVGMEFKTFTSCVRINLTKPEAMEYFVKVFKKEFGKL
ncbi:MAG: aminotransferase class I/II-fold pyridoxal phosphate-dependent enzyme [Emcibacteraceae bacterium]|nr:aminotransferase class I/II-fold pyridoxal phosphate-dependent enzyme [Emcibacteraceae bacterium]